MSIHKNVLSTVSLEFSALARKKFYKGDKLISLGLGEPNWPTPKKIIEASYSSMLKGETKYASPWGTPELINKLRNKFKKKHININPKEIIITLGSKQALSLCLTSVLEPKDEVILVSPSYVSYKPQIKMAEKSSIIREISLDKSTLRLNFQKLKNLINTKTKVILINFPNNPTGAILTKNEIKKLIKLAKSYNLYIISDEIYSSMMFKKNIFSSLLEYRNLYEKIFIINGFSKCYSMTGWRIGYLIGPQDHIIRVSVLQQHLNTNIPVFIQRGAEAALDLPANYLKKYNKVYFENAKFLKKFISKNKLLSCKKISGGMFSMIDISRLNQNSDLFCSELLNFTNVAVTPGIIFGKNWDDHIRVSLAANNSDFKEGIRRLINFVNTKFYKK